MVSNKQLYYFSVLLALLIHGPMLFVSFENTYDAFVHIFFAEHYASNWFDHWNYKWYTGFTVTSYPPQVHMLIALISKLIGLKGGFICVTLVSVVLFIRGVFYFSQLWVSERSAAYASCAATVCSSYVEAVHIFGQLPSIAGIAILLNVLPVIYSWVITKKKRYLLLSLGLLSIITTTHHVTTIFGMVFFIFPVLGLALMDKAALKHGSITIKYFLLALKDDFFSLLFFGICSIIVTVGSIFPYWYWSKSDPISQIPIPHGSRDSFIEVMSSGLVFFLIPWGLMLLFLPYLFHSVFKRRNLILGISISLAFVLGTGGTTPIPLKLLGETAFNILTLDRFTYWATILSLPFWGDFLFQFIQGGLKQHIISKIGSTGFKITLVIFAFVTVGSTIFIMNIGYFRPFQPKKIDIQPIQNFLSRDNHDQWRYLTLGFGDQVAWLAANTDAQSIDGNYHSARRLPEMTTRIVERLENAKYQGLQGLGALHQFLTVPEKYNLKYIFNNDKFYEPILYFSGWNNVQRLENNIDIWEKPDVPKLPELLPRKHISKTQQLMWSIYPISILSIVLLSFLFSFLLKFPLKEKLTYDIPAYSSHWTYHIMWAIIVALVIALFFANQKLKNRPHQSPESITTAFFNALDFKYFDQVYDFYDPENKPSKEQIFLDISLEDGIINSFGKLNALQLENTIENENEALVKVTAEWITSMKAYSTQHDIRVFKRHNKWYLKAPERDIKIPPARTVSTPTMTYASLGKRDGISGNTDQSDILDRPDIALIEANLVENNDQYYIIGHIMNTDVVPAYITVTGTLLNESGEDIISYNARDHISSRLSPKESTYFKIDFTDIVTQYGIREDINTYENTENPFCLTDLPFSFKLIIKSLESKVTNYSSLAVINPQITESGFSSSIYNYGSKGVNIPRLLITTLDQNQKLLWVDNHYLEKEIRPLRSKSVNIQIIDPKYVALISSISNKDVLVNGYQEDVFIPSQKQHEGNLFPFENKYCHIKANGYIVK